MLFRSPAERKTEIDMEEAFKARSSYLLGALLNLLSNTLKQLPKIKKENLPRMADFAVLGMAVEKALKLKEGSFINAYLKGQLEMRLKSLDDNPFLHCLTDHIKKNKVFSGTYQQLYLTLNTTYKTHKSDGWPNSAKKVACLIKRHQSALFDLGINIKPDPERKEDGFHVRISKKI